MNFAQELNKKATIISKLKKIEYNQQNDKITTFVNFTKRAADRCASEGKFKTSINIMKCGLNKEEANEAYTILHKLGFKTRKDWLTGSLVIVSWK